MRCSGRGSPPISTASRRGSSVCARGTLRTILLALWRDIPEADNGFYNNLMQALATTTPSEGYSRDLITELESRFSEMIRATLPTSRRQSGARQPPRPCPVHGL